MKEQNDIVKPVNEIQLKAEDKQLKKDFLFIPVNEVMEKTGGLKWLP